MGLRLVWEPLFELLFCYTKTNNGAWMESTEIDKGHGGEFIHIFDTVFNTVIFN